ncbi:ATP-binding protein [Slackia exigua]|uniref:ATP-binding protein n=1 Tax=Slackia exigua TaxID=84109 RepID=UPI00210BF69D|nr:ATP-binding protein [Slackia exigua]MCQ5091237.1 ATP-binding protein [Slackia exigua]
MYKFETVRREIEKLDGGTFQALGQHYAMLRFNLSSPVFFGMSPGTLKTVKGTPDAYYKDEKGSFVFIECGHVTAGLSQATKKIHEDIEKCLEVIDESPTSLTVSKIICCYTYPYIDPSKQAELIALDRDRVILIGADEIARDICDRFFCLAGEYLGLGYPNGNVLDFEKFVLLHREDAYAAPLDNAIVGREDESNAIFSALESGKTTVIYGKSGCGKTRLALDAAKRFCEQKNAFLSIIRPGIQRALYKELREYYGIERNYIILVDDINQLFDIGELVEFCLLNRNIHLICTVRNYALDRALESLKRLGDIVQIALEPMDKGSIELILREGYSIRNQVFLDQIIKVAKGNLRLAVLAAEKAKGGFAEITNCKDLLDLCYGNAVNQWGDNCVLACEIAALLGPHVTIDNKSLETIEGALSISHEDYLDACVELCAKEVMDMVHGYRAVSLDEQNLRDYFIYRCLVVGRKISLEDLWLLEQGQAIAAKVVNVLFGVFNDESLFDFTKKSVKSMWPKLSKEDKHSAIETFNSLIETEAFLFLRQCIRDLNSGVGDYSAIGPSWSSGNDMIASSILKSLCVLLRGSNVGVAVDLIFEHLEIDSSPIDDFCTIFYHRMKPVLEYGAVDYRIVEAVLNRFESKVKSGISDAEKALLLLFSKSVMDDELSGVHCGEGNEVSFFYGALPFSNDILNVRRRCMDCLGQVDSSMQQEVLLGYRPTYDCSNDKRLAIATYKIIDDRLDFCQAATLQKTVQVINLSFFMEHSGYESHAVDRFVNSTWQHRLLFAALRRELSIDESGSNQIDVLAAEASRDSVNQLIDLLESGMDSSIQSEWAIDEAVKILFEWLRENAPDVFKFAIHRYLQKGLAPKQIGPIIASYFFDEGNPRNGRETLLSASCVNRDMWANEYDGYCIVSKGCIPDKEAIFESLRQRRVPLHRTYIWKADELSPGFFLACVASVMESSENDALDFSFLFPYLEDKEGMGAVRRSIEKDDGLQLIERAVLNSIDNDAHRPPKATIDLLLERDPEYLRIVVSALLSFVREECWADWMADIIWSGLFSFEDIKLLVSTLREQAESANLYATRRFLGKLFGVAEDHGMLHEALSLITELEETFPDDSLIRGLYEDLSQSAKIEYAVRLGKDGASWDKIRPLASDSRSFESWSGSYMSVLNRRREVTRMVQERLNFEGIHSYDLDFMNLYQSFDEVAEQTEIRDFTDPYL